MFNDAPTTVHLDRAAAEAIDRDLARLTRRDGRLALEDDPDDDGPLTPIAGS